MKAHLAVVGTFLKEIEIWDLDLGDPIEPLQTLKGHSGSITSLQIHPVRNNIMASGCSSGEIRIWNTVSLSQVDQLPTDSKEVHTIKWNPENESVLAAHSGERMVRFFDLKASSQKSVGNALIPCKEVEVFEFGPKGSNSMFVGTSEGQILQMDLRKMDAGPVCAFQAHEKSIPGLVCSGSHLVSNSLDGKLRIWRLESGAPPKLIKEKQTPLKKLFVSDIHPENPYLFACGAEGSNVVVWDYYKEVMKGQPTFEPTLPKPQQQDQ